MPNDIAVTRSSLAEQIKDHLLQAILSGRYLPDERIVETRVAREMGTSQAPVREALRGLEALGVVEIHPFRGARVRRPTLHELLEAYTVRAELECLAARLALPLLTADGRAALEALHAEMQSAAAGNDPHEVAVKDAAFHARLVDLAGNATLSRVWRSLEPFSRTYLTLLAPGANARWTADLHPPILDAILAGDTNAVEAALRQHFALASQRLAAGWASPGGTSPPG